MLSLAQIKEEVPGVISGNNGNIIKFNSIKSLQRSDLIELSFILC